MPFGPDTFFASYRIGKVNGPLELTNSRLNVLGGLTVTSRLDLTGGQSAQIHVGGSTLTIGGILVSDADTWIYFDSGSINTGLPPLISGNKVGPGYLTGNPVP